MAEYTAGFNLGQPNATQLHTLQRHRDILQGYSHEFAKTKVCLQEFMVETIYSVHSFKQKCISFSMEVVLVIYSDPF